MNKVEELLKKIEDSGTRVIYLTKYGSHLYGTNTPKSDLDFKGVFLPTKEEILLGKVPRTKSFSTKSSAKDEKNNSDDLDCELYSYSYFLELAESGQTVALEMLWSSGLKQETVPGNVIVSSDYWFDLVSLRNKFITTNMKAFMGYAKSQAVKYSLKGDKMNTARKVKETFEHLKNISDSISKEIPGKLVDYFEFLEEAYKNDPNVEFSKDKNGLRMMVVCKRALQESITFKKALETVDGILKKYGHRAQQAAEHDGADFKAISHAYRIALELKDLYATNRLEFPFDESRKCLLLSIKEGNFKVSEIMDALDFQMSLIEDLSSGHNLPDKVDKNIRISHVLKMYESIVKGEI